MTWDYDCSWRCLNERSSAKRTLAGNCICDDGIYDARLNRGFHCQVKPGSGDGYMGYAEGHEPCGAPGGCYQILTGIVHQR